MPIKKIMDEIVGKKEVTGNELFIAEISRSLVNESRFARKNSRKFSNAVGSEDTCKI